MHTDKEMINKIVSRWDLLLLNEKESMNLSESELSALSSWVKDCYLSYNKLYQKILQSLCHVTSEDYDSIHDCVVETYWELDHIMQHISAARKGLSILMGVVADKSMK
jgi:hypothetical protein